MKKQIITMATALLLTACGGTPETTAKAENSTIQVEQFADLQILVLSRTRIWGFVSQNKKNWFITWQKLPYREETYSSDQNGKYNLTIRRMLEAVYTGYQGDKSTPDFKAMEVHFKRVWFSNGIHHHYGCEKFMPGFTSDFLKQALLRKLHIAACRRTDRRAIVRDEIFPSSSIPISCRNGWTKQPVKIWYWPPPATIMKEWTWWKRPKTSTTHWKIWKTKLLRSLRGLNSRLVKVNGKIQEKVWKVGGLYGQVYLED